MGHHYVPQRYLRQFECLGEQGLIWQYTRGGRPPKQIPIKVAAQVSGFYHPDVEKHLASQIELPGSDALEKLIGGGRLDADERLSVAIYLGVMLKRVPAHRRRTTEMVPGVLAQVMADFRGGVREVLEAEPARLSTLLAEADRIEKKYQEDLPQNVKDQIREPYPSERILGAIATMQWQVFVSEGPQLFLTSDNPFFFTRGIGLANPQSEFFLPISPRHMLHGYRGHAGPGIPFVKTPQSVVRQANRRTATGAESVVFSQKTCGWLPKVLTFEEDGGYIPNWTPKPLS